MPSSTDIANMALGRLGVSNAIGSLNETSLASKTCARFYDSCRREVLRDHPWGFASTAVSIAEVANQTFPGWNYVYQYPQKGLMVWSVADEGGIRQWCNYYLSITQWGRTACADLLRRYPFKTALGADSSTKVILSDTQDAWAYYTFDVTNTAIFPDDFINVFAWRLAMEVGGPLRCDTSFVTNARNEFLFWKSQATAQDMNEQRDDIPPDSPSISCRN